MVSDQECDLWSPQPPLWTDQQSQSLPEDDQRPAVLWAPLPPLLGDAGRQHQRARQRGRRQIPSSRIEISRHKHADWLTGEKVVFILTLTSPSQGRTQKYFGGYFAHMYNTIVKARDWSKHPSDPTWRFSLLWNSFHIWTPNSLIFNC